MSDSPVFAAIAKYGIVPVIAIDSPDAAIPLADALAEGGLPVAEITFRTAAAAAAIEKISSQRPDILVGAGTVLTVENLKAAKECGAKFAVAPGVNRDIVIASQEIGLPLAPGVATPSDIEAGLSLGCKLLKFFPSEALGGVAMIKALAAPYRHTGVRFVPTGGVNTGNLESYLSLPVVAAVGGTWIAKQDDLQQGKWQEIRDRCQAAVEIVARIRSQ